MTAEHNETALSVGGVNAGESGLMLRNLNDYKEFASMVAKSGLAPKGIDTPAAILVAMQMGAEVGLTHMAALQNIAVINGRPALWGDAPLAIARSSGLLEKFEEVEVGQRGSDTYGFKAVIKRAGFPEASETFTVEDAKRAHLWGKAGPWKQYPKRMLRMRARQFVLRDAFGDLLKGFRSADEVRDMSAEERFNRASDVGPKTAKDKTMEARTQPEQQGILDALDLGGVEDKSQAYEEQPEPEPVEEKPQTHVAKEKPSPEPESAPLPSADGSTAHVALTEALERAELTVGDFCDYAKRSGWITTKEGFLDVSKENVMKVLNSHETVFKLIKMAKSVEEPLSNEEIF